MKIGDALGFLVGIEVDFFESQKGDIANIYVEIDLSKGFYSELEIISDLGRWKQKVIRLGKALSGKCLLRNQIVNNSSLAVSLGALNIPPQNSEPLVSPESQKRTLDWDTALDPQAGALVHALSKPLRQSLCNASS